MMKYARLAAIIDANRITTVTNGPLKPVITSYFPFPLKGFVRSVAALFLPFRGGFFSLIIRTRRISIGGVCFDGLGYSFDGPFVEGNLLASVLATILAFVIPLFFPLLPFELESKLLCCS